jgi:hypothetical protein
MSKNKNPSSYRIEPNPQKKSFKIFSDKKTHDKIIKFLLQNDHFVKDHRSFSSHFLEIDHRGLKSLLERSASEINVSAKKKIPFSNEDIAKESALEQTLAQKEYDLDLRIWQNDEASKNYCCEVDGEIYSCVDLDNLISFLHGEVLVESNKPITSFSINPFTVFGSFGVAADALSSDKSVIRYNFQQGKRKKQFHPIIENIHHFRIVIDGADDTANAMNNTGLPQQTIALIQGLVIFPLFLKGVHLGYEGLGEEAKETADEFQESHIKRAEIEVKLEKFKQDLCEKCSIDYDSIKTHAPQKFLKIIARELTKTTDLAVKNQIAELALKYQQEVEIEFKAPEIKDVLAAHCGWLAMTAMMTSVGVYEAQAVVNIFGGIDKITTGVETPLLSFIGNSFGFAGQSLMTIYAFHKMIDERKEWKEAEAELEKFRNAKDVSDLARQITNELLAAKRDNHRLQTFGNAALSAGQAMMAVGGPIGIGLNPLLYAGLVSTLGGVAVNSISELKYQASYQISEDLDELEKDVITKAPQFTKDDFNNIGEALSKHAKERILKLEILGHLRAPQLVLYQKFLKENEDDSGILSKAVGFLGADRIASWLNKPPVTSTDLVKDNPLIAAHRGNKNDLDIFTVEEFDLNQALARYQELSRGESHLEAIKKLQEEFIAEKSRVAALRTTETVKELCASIIKKGGASSSYLTKKLMRAVANADLRYGGDIEEGIPEIRKNGKKITVAKLDLDKFDETELENFLSQKRIQKHNISSQKKKSPLAKAHEKELYVVKSDHLRPFAEIAKVSNVTTDFLDSDEQKHTKPKQKEHKEESLFATRSSSATKHQPSHHSKHVAQNSSSLATTRIRDDLTQVSNVMPEHNAKFSSSKHSEKILLEEFKSLTTEKVSQNQAERQKQIKKQNKVIDKVLEKSREFVLKSQVKDHKKNQTIFTYLDPDHQNPDDPDYEAKQVIYVRNNSNGKIDVLYGEKARALVIERPNQIKNGLITKIDGRVIEYCGEISGSIFQSFKKVDSSKGLPTGSTRRAQSLNLMGIDGSTTSHRL